MKQILSANNTIVYDNMKSEREIITNATAVAVAKKSRHSCLRRSRPSTGNARQIKRRQPCKEETIFHQR
jgi:hypothetical protein